MIISPRLHLGQIIFIDALIHCLSLNHPLKTSIITLVSILNSKNDNITYWNFAHAGVKLTSNRLHRRYNPSVSAYLAWKIMRAKFQCCILLFLSCLMSIDFIQQIADPLEKVCN